jgi:radical SAM protein with 4Fe4S-binding SPASM domain
MVALWQVVRRDLAAFRQTLFPLRPPAPGLYTYRFSPRGGRVRIHLRIQADRSGVLFIDVTDVLHLNQTSAEMIKWALDGIPQSEAASCLAARFGTAASAAWRADLEATYRMADRLANPSAGCPTCALPDVRRPALFSAPVSAPYKADLAITYDCNNDCPHCYNEADRLSMDMMPAADWRRAIDRLADVGVPHLIFTGGEATLHPQLPDIIHHADQRGPICGLNTNGRRMAQRGYVDQLEAAGLNHVQFTLGSHRPEVHDRMMNAKCFEQTVRGIENALASGIHTITNTTLMQMNAGQIEQTIEFLHRLGIRTFAVNGMIYSGGGFATGQAIAEHEMPAHLVRIRDRAAELDMKFLWYTPTQYCRLSPVELEIGAKRCNAGEYSLCVEPNGDVLPCQSYYTAAGNLLRDPWEKIWKSELFVSFRDRELAPEQHGLPEMCWECPDLTLCGGGCRIEREAQDGLGSGDGGCAGCSGTCGNTQAAGFVDLENLLVSNKRRGSGAFAEA